MEQADGSAYGVAISSVEVEDADEAEGEAARKLKRLPQQVAKGFGPGAQLESSREVEVDGNPGVEYTVTTMDKGKQLTIRSQAFVANDGEDLVQLIVAGSGPAEARKFFASFELEENGDDDDD